MANIFDLFRSIESTGASNAPITHMIVGLGNPEKKYEGTRHNIGFDAVLAIADKAGIRIANARFHALVGDGMIDGVRTLLMMPETYMNLSGVAVAEAAAFYKIPPSNILVLCDDVSFDVGRMRLRAKGSAGGHNGLKSIIEKLGSDAFPRLKIGVGQKPHPEYDLADWVLGRFPEADRATLRERMPLIHEVASLVVRERMDDALTAIARGMKGEGK